MECPVLVATSRNRSMGGFSVPQGGTIKRTVGGGIPTVTGPSTYSLRSQATFDIIGDWGKDHPFQADTITRKMITPMSGNVIVPPSVVYQVENFHPSRVATLAAPALMTVPGTDSSKAPTVFSRGNPSRPSFDAAVFLGELRDFPGLARQIWRHALPIAWRLNRRGVNRLEALDHGIRDAALHFAKNADSNYLAYQFGWKPFVADIKKFLDVSQAIHRRVHTLNKLIKYGKAGTKIDLDEGAILGSSVHVAINTLGLVFYGDEITHQMYKRWGTSKWFLTPGGALDRARHDPEQVIALARQVVSGVNVDLSTSWNLMPWTWLLDWAGNTGDWIQSQRNIIGASHGNACIMTTRKSSTLCTRTPGKGSDTYPQVSGGNYLVSREQKLRTSWPAGTLPELTIPILTDRQTSILGALVTTRVIKR
jgi:hypothetical protein